MEDISSSIREKIARTQKDVITATNKANDLRRKAAEYDQRAKELETFLRYLQNWLNEVNGVTLIPFTETEPSGRNGVGQFVREYIRSFDEFSGAELIEAIRSDYPEIEGASIRSALSHCKKDGLVERLSNDKYKTVISQPTAPPSVPRPPSIPSEDEDIDEDVWTDEEEPLNRFDIITLAS